MPEMTDCMIRELELASVDFPEKNINTIYFGGGTPSLLTIDTIEKFLSAAAKLFYVSADAEVTLEANPDDITKEKLFALKNAGINRLSIGIQSFHEKELQWMNRAHNAEQALNSIKFAQDAGFNNISIDLIYGVPGMSDKEWEQNIRTAIKGNVQHIACYALTVEPYTALDKMIIQKKKEAADPEMQARQFMILMHEMQQAGFEHYEISNFAKPGYRSRHNSSYWQGKPYLGIGPSAHSYFKGKRKWNISNNALYIKSLHRNLIPFEEEELTENQQMNEMIMISLRTSEGLNMEDFALKFSEAKTDELKKNAAQFIKTGKIYLQGNKLILTNEGKLFADGIAATLFFI